MPAAPNSTSVNRFIHLPLMNAVQGHCILAVLQQCLWCVASAWLTAGCLGQLLSLSRQYRILSPCMHPGQSFCLPLLAITTAPKPTRYHSSTLNWHFAPHSPTLFTTNALPEKGRLVITARQLTKTMVLAVQAGLDSFARVGGPTRGGFVPHSVESYSANATIGGLLGQPLARGVCQTK